MTSLPAISPDGTFTGKELKQIRKFEDEAEKLWNLAHDFAESAAQSSQEG